MAQQPAQRCPRVPSLSLWWQPHQASHSSCSRVLCCQPSATLAFVMMVDGLPSCHCPLPAEIADDAFDPENYRQIMGVLARRLQEKVGEVERWREGWHSHVLCRHREVAQCRRWMRGTHGFACSRPGWQLLRCLLQAAELQPFTAQFG